MSNESNKTDANVSSDSSWTLINESDTASRSNSSENIKICVNNDNATKEVLEVSAESPALEKNIEKEIGNFEIVNRIGEASRKKKSSKPKKSKEGNDFASSLSIAACLLTIAGITLLTTFMPLNYVETTDVDTLQRHLSEVYDYNHDPTAKNAVNSIHATLDSIDIAKSMDLFNRVSDNLTDDEICEVAFPEYYNSSLTPEEVSQLRINIITPYSEIFEDSPKPIEPALIKEKVQNKPKSLIDRAKQLIKSPSLQMFVATLVQDLCLIKLISEFSKRTRAQSSSEDKDKTKSASKRAKSIKKSSNSSKRKIKKTESVQKKEKKLKKNQKLATSLFPEGQLPASQFASNISINENGKSECERRFEELDSKWATLGQNHRQKIQQIKNKFQKEILQISEKEQQSFNRKQKISFTREKFIQRLKADREVYLHQLRKLREERQKVLNDVCQNFKNSRNLSPKDVSVGNFAVLLPSDYNFLKKLQEIKDKESSRTHINLEATNNETVSYVPTESSSPEEQTETIKEKAYERNKTDYNELRRKYLRRKAKFLKKRQAKKDAKEVQNVVTNIVTSLSQATSKSLIKHASQESTFLDSTPPENSTDDKDFQVVQRKKASKRNISGLYDAAFEDQSKKIKQQDMVKWNRTFEDFKWTVPTDAITKQDPLKSHRPKIIHKGLL